MSVTIVNISSDMKVVDQILYFLEKHKDKKIYFSSKVFYLLLLECNEKKTKDYVENTLIFNEDAAKYNFIITDVYNKILEHKFMRLDSIREENKDTSIFNRYNPLVSESDKNFFFAVEDEDIGHFAKKFWRSYMCQYI